MPKSKKLTGSEVVLNILQKQGVELMLGYTGGAIMPTFDQLPKYPKIRFITARHEQGAGFIAQGYTRASGKLAPVLVTSGPGATNTITAVADAKMDSVPMLVISGQVATGAIGSDAFQESDITGMMYTCTKEALMPLQADEIATSLGQLLKIATHGRPGPVSLDLPKNVQTELTEKIEIPKDLNLPGLPIVPTPSSDKIKQIINLIKKAKRPILILGHGVILSQSQKEILDFVNITQIPVGMTLHGISSLPASHPQNLGMIGQHGEIEANREIQNADLILAFGMRFDDRVTAKLEAFGKNAKIVHIEVDFSEIDKNVKVDVALHTDLKQGLEALNLELQKNPLNYSNEVKIARQAQTEIIKQNKVLSQKNYAEIFEKGVGKNGRLLMSRIMHELSNFTKGQDNIVSDVGQHQMFAAKFYKYEKFNTWFNSGGLGTMGFCLPAAVGVKLARPKEEVWAINGDGGFQMNIQELGTMMQEKLNINILILNNEYLGMVKQWQNLFFKDNLVETEMTNPDFSKLAEAYGVAYKKVETVEEILPALKWAKQEILPTIVEFACDRDEHVYPMIHSSMDYSQMIINEGEAKKFLQKSGAKKSDAPG